MATSAGMKALLAKQKALVAKIRANAASSSSSSSSSKSTTTSTNKSSSGSSSGTSMSGRYPPSSSGGSSKTTPAPSITTPPVVQKLTETIQPVKLSTPVVSKPSGISPVFQTVINAMPPSDLKTNLLNVPVAPPKSTGTTPSTGGGKGPTKEPVVAVPPVSPTVTPTDILRGLSEGKNVLQVINENKPIVAPTNPSSGGFSSSSMSGHDIIPRKSIKAQIYGNEAWNIWKYGDNTIKVTNKAGDIVGSFSSVSEADSWLNKTYINPSGKKATTSDDVILPVVTNIPFKGKYNETTIDYINKMQKTLPSAPPANLTGNDRTGMTATPSELTEKNTETGEIDIGIRMPKQGILGKLYDTDREMSLEKLYYIGRTSTKDHPEGENIYAPIVEYKLDFDFTPPSTKYSSISYNLQSKIDETANSLTILNQNIDIYNNIISDINSYTEKKVNVDLEGNGNYQTMTKSDAIAFYNLQLQKEKKYKEEIEEYVKELEKQKKMMQKYDELGYGIRETIEGGWEPYYPEFADIETAEKERFGKADLGGKIALSLVGGFEGAASAFVEYPWALIKTGWEALPYTEGKADLGANWEAAHKTHYETTVTGVFGTRAQAGKPVEAAFKGITSPTMTQLIYPVAGGYAIGAVSKLSPFAGKAIGYTMLGTTAGQTLWPGITEGDWGEVTERGTDIIKSLPMALTTWGIGAKYGQSGMTSFMATRNPPMKPSTFGWGNITKPLYSKFSSGVVKFGKVTESVAERFGGLPQDFTPKGIWTSFRRFVPETKILTERAGAWTKGDYTIKPLKASWDYGKGLVNEAISGKTKGTKKLFDLETVSSEKVSMSKDWTEFTKQAKEGGFAHATSDIIGKQYGEWGTIEEAGFLAQAKQNIQPLSKVFKIDNSSHQAIQDFGIKHKLTFTGSGAEKLLTNFSIPKWLRFKGKTSDFDFLVDANPDEVMSLASKLAYELTQKTGRKFSVKAGGHEGTWKIMDGKKGIVDLTANTVEPSLVGSLPVETVNVGGMKVADLRSQTFRKLEIAAERGMKPAPKGILEKIGNDLFKKEWKNLTKHQRSDVIKTALERDMNKALLDLKIMTGANYKEIVVVSAENFLKGKIYTRGKTQLFKEAVRRRTGIPFEEMITGYAERITESNPAQYRMFHMTTQKGAWRGFLGLDKTSYEQISLFRKGYSKRPGLYVTKANALVDETTINRLASAIKKGGSSEYLMEAQKIWTEQGRKPLFIPSAKAITAGYIKKGSFETEWVSLTGQTKIKTGWTPQRADYVFDSTSYKPTTKLGKLYDAYGRKIASITKTRESAIDPMTGRTVNIYPIEFVPVEGIVGSIPKVTTVKKISPYVPVDAEGTIGSSLSQAISKTASKISSLSGIRNDANIHYIPFWTPKGITKILSTAPTSYLTTIEEPISDSYAPISKPKYEKVDKRYDDVYPYETQTSEIYPSKSDKKPKYEKVEYKPDKYVEPIPPYDYTYDYDDYDYYSPLPPYEPSPPRYYYRQPPPPPKSIYIIPPPPPKDEKKKIAEYKVSSTQDKKYKERKYDIQYVWEMPEFKQPAEIKTTKKTKQKYTTFEPDVIQNPFGDVKPKKQKAKNKNEIDPFIRF